MLSRLGNIPIKSWYFWENLCISIWKSQWKIDKNPFEYILSGHFAILYSSGKQNHFSTTLFVFRGGGYSPLPPADAPEYINIVQLSIKVSVVNCSIIILVHYKLAIIRGHGRPTGRSRERMGDQNRFCENLILTVSQRNFFQRYQGGSPRFKKRKCKFDF